MFKDLQSDTPQLCSGTCKCESHTEMFLIRVLNLFALRFSVHVVPGRLFFSGVKTLSWYVYWVKRGEGAWQKINDNKESVAPKKRNQAKIQKKTHSLIFFFVVNTSMPKVILKVEDSRTSRKRPPKMQRLRGRLRPYGRNHRGSLQSEGTGTSTLGKIIYWMQFLSDAMCFSMLLPKFFVYSNK